jgi:hypothetical protein
MLQHEMVIGIAAGLVLSAILRWTPSWRDLLVAMVAAVLIDFTISSRALPGAIASLHVCPCMALAFIGVLAVLHVMRRNGRDY